MLLIITGGTGSLGKAILDYQEFLKSHGITRIRVLSRDEQKQVFLQRSYTGEIPLDCYLGDVSDRERMLFGLKDAHYLVHAAAQKHIDKFELDVKTGYKNNILGTQNVAEAFLNSKHAESAVFVSTDKAALPITSYGISKLASEHLWLWHNTFQKEIAFGVARYGNIFGSRGSVIETWKKLAEEKKEIQITDETCTRFFMPIHEAAKFVLETLFSQQNSVKIPKMKAAKMIDVARMIWEHHNPGEDLLWRETGMRGIEKVHEILEGGGLSSDEVEKFNEVELLHLYRDWLERLPK